MAARSLWNGTITFGSVAIPVKLFTATSTHTLRFREVRASDGARIEHRRIGAETGDEVAYAEIEKAYDTGKGMVVLTPEEIAAADGSQPKVLAIEHFVSAAQIDPVYYDKPYFVGVQSGGERAYRVLLAALEQSERVGIGRFVLRSREQLVAVRPIHGALGLQTMRYHDELVRKDDLELPPLRKKPREREVEMAGKLVDMLTGEWDPDEHEDSYRAAVLELIEQKRSGAKPAPAKQKREESDDLAAALEASLAGSTGKKRSASGAKPKAAAKSTAKTPAKSKAKTPTTSDAKSPAKAKAKPRPKAKTPTKAGS